MPFTEEQIAFRDMVRRVAEKEVAPRAEEIDATDEFPADLAKLFGELGLLQLWVPEEYGGPGGDLTTVCIAKEEIGKYSLTASALCGNNSIGLILPVLHLGTEAQKQKYLTESGTGTKIAAVAITEPQTGSDVRSMKTTARRTEAGTYVLNGRKNWITWGGHADYVLVFAKTAEGNDANAISAFIVDTTTRGFGLGRKERKMGRNGAPNHELTFEDMEVPAECMLGEEGTGFKSCMKILDLNRPTVAASSLGLAQGALDTAIAYCKERVQFGQPVARFQGMQFKLADMAMKTEAARALLYSVAAEIDSGDHSRLAMIAAMAKCYVTDVAMDVTSEAVSAMGSAGYSKDYPVERMMRDAKLNQIIEGTNEIQRLIIGRQLTR